MRLSDIQTTLEYIWKGWLSETTATMLVVLTAANTTYPYVGFAMVWTNDNFKPDCNMHIQKRRFLTGEHTSMPRCVSTLDRDNCKHLGGH